MVGVPGRSKACSTCRKRRIACSLEKPTCNICVKSKRQCGGYERERIFVLDPRTQDTISESAPAEKVLQSLQSDVDIVQTNKTTSKVHLQQDGLGVLPPELQGTISLRSAYTSLWTISSPSTRAIYREQVISEFLYSFLPRDNSPAGAWLTLLPSHSNFTSALEASSLAVCTAHLGHLHSSPTLVHESLKFYTQALWEMQRALWNDDLMMQNETLAACVLLIMYEAIECPEKTVGAWEGHMKGCAKMFETRGPSSFNDDFGHLLFLSFRQLEIQNAIVWRRKTFLTQTAWLEKPWNSRPKDFWHKLLDMEAQLATGIASVYQRPPNASPEDFIVHLLDVVRFSWDLDTRLNLFYNDYEAQHEGLLYWSAVSNGFSTSIENMLVSTEDPVFAEAFQFPDLGTASTCLLYWALTSILWSGMAAIYQILEAIRTQAQLQGHGTITSFPARAEDANDTPPQTIPIDFSNPIPEEPPTSARLSGIDLNIFALLPPLEHRTDVSAPAKKICQSLEYCVTTRQGMVGATAAIFPLKVAIESLCDSGRTRELEWAKSAMAKISGKGVKILDHLGSKIETKHYLPG